VLHLLLPLRYDLIQLGGSWSQRQVLTFTTIQAAIRSNNLPLSLSLVAELKVLTHLRRFTLQVVYSHSILSTDKKGVKQ